MLALKIPAVAPDSLFTEGFIHCSRAEQVPDTIERFFSEVDEIMILELDRDALGDSVKDEESSDHGVFPHIYRAVEIDEIVRLISFIWSDLIVLQCESSNF